MVGHRVAMRSGPMANARAAGLIRGYEARIAALERRVGKPALEPELSQRGRGTSDRGRKARLCP